ncbi:MAG: hypothetical protein V3T16_02805 [Gemmatimonadales bacterium]
MPSLDIRRRLLVFLGAFMLPLSVAAGQNEGLERPATEDAQASGAKGVAHGGAYLDLGYAFSNNRPPTTCGAASPQLRPSIG